MNEKIVAYLPTEKTDQKVHISRLKGQNQYRKTATIKTMCCQICHKLGKGVPPFRNSHILPHT